KRVLIDHAQEAGRTAPVLYVGLPLCVGRGEIEGAHLAEEARQVGRDGRAPPPFSLHLGVAGARAALRLDGLDGRREGYIAGWAGHGAASRNKVGTLMWCNLAAPLRRDA